MSAITGIAVDHQVALDGLKFIRPAKDSVWLCFANSAVKGGYTVVVVPFLKFTAMLGKDLAEWLRYSLAPDTASAELVANSANEFIYASEFLWVEKADNSGKQWMTWFIADKDDEAVLVVEPLEHSTEELGATLQGEILKRGAEVKAIVLAAINKN